MLRLLRLIAGVLLLPLCVAVTLALLDTLRSIPDTGVLLSAETRTLLAGFFLWLGMWFFLPQPFRAYVVAHELTHAFWGALFGARVSDLRVSERGGSVRLSRSNLLITLAPYFFPLYTILVVLLRLLAGLFLNPMPCPLLWLFFVGFTWCFHITFTLQSLMTRQPDIQEYGRIFSYAVIYLFNLAGVGLWVVCTTTASFDTLATALALHTRTVCQQINQTVLLCSRQVYALLLPALKRLWIRPAA
ncbi:MAG TPA: hypothetical protein P5125_04250 [Kiritimatiellia bacterium]|jgi:hypothetical protein|nr:hypothetical protein [Kiritimatiellia bacterium]HOM58237.1 hypothetical protein [Kiritimatiellia bacterium]HOR96915.1 hypothetical protein [Kiritimatiellia bacterium]HPC48741.1 hypothetical protein [Kiritimatiellia bacterium]HPW75905.1 hypothetical protein [Kiritimatiellia bacterium]